MVFNLTEIDVDLYFAVNTSVNILLFALVVPPALILTVLCVLDLVWQMTQCNYVRHDIRFQQRRAMNVIIEIFMTWNGWGQY